MVPGLFLVNFVINIGYSRAWKNWPVIISAALLLAAAGFGFASQGTVQTPVLASTLFFWEFYIFLHLGVSFVLAGILATPGCEMRAPFHLFSLLTGKTTKEHHCPVGPLNALDKWERERK
ncbi:hypothetical protein MNBD_ALPHA06-2307 [hydrothermal vent metagenome]|uniref:Uncharacterized protein n=1 Tax=hydrothermal vent metagenome TaxID=652676 RepID=A0A3B0S7V1_9ZZZZ